jgi:hypothetical protein
VNTPTTEAGKALKDRWEDAAQAFLSACYQIDGETLWKSVEPEWWLLMTDAMNEVRGRLVRSRRK